MTGGVVLALELLASRVMTPYFGVSLYIWSSILSTTLMFLALGYAWGGHQCRQRDSQSLRYAFLRSPALSAASIAIASAIYPILLPKLASIGLITGSFIASTLILGPPLILLAAMNPILVALLDTDRVSAGKPAGRVFFVSTVGSVAGVLICAFVVIPLLTNYRALLLMSISLCIATAVTTRFSPQIAMARRRRLYLISLTITIVSGALLAAKDQYIDWMTAENRSPFEVRILAEFSSIYGNVKVAELQLKLGDSPPFLAYLQDGVVQNRATIDGVSLSPYTYVLEALSRAYAPDAKRGLVLGLGAGIVPRNLSRRGIEVTTVDINEDALQAASRFFGFDPTGIDIQWADARTFVRNCRGEYDVVVIDLFQGDYAPEHLFTEEFFRDVAGCLTREGVLVMNTVFESTSELAIRTFLATIHAAFGSIVTYRLPGANAFVVATRHEPMAVRKFDLDGVPLSMRAFIAAAVDSGEAVRESTVRGIEPLSDEHNVFNVLFVDAHMAHRLGFVTNLPPNVLMN
jgi:predicted membrane-bound spermidine synthase